MSHKAHMHGGRESHSGIVPTKRSNAGRGGPKEIVEGRPLTEENAEEPNPYRTPSRESGPSGLDRVRQAAKGEPKMRFTALLHHVDIELLRSSYYNLKRGAAAGVDGVTWQEYGDGLAKLKDVRQKLRKRMHESIEENLKWLQSVVRGYFQYHAVPGNQARIKGFRNDVLRLWFRQIRRRSQKCHPSNARILPGPLNLVLRFLYRLTLRLSVCGESNSALIPAPSS